MFLAILGHSPRRVLNSLLVMAKIVTPRIGAVLEERRQTVNGDLEKARNASAEAAKIRADYESDLEFGTLEKLAKEGQVMTFFHDGFWECADTVRDIENVNKLWESGSAPWKVW